MPSYAHLATEELNFKTIQERVQAVSYLGVPYERELKEAEQMAMEQAMKIATDIKNQEGPAGLEKTKMVALIAYLQRVGTDLFAPPPPPASPAAEKKETPVAEVPGGEVKKEGTGGGE